MRNFRPAAAGIAACGMGRQAILTRRGRQPVAVPIFFLQTEAYGGQNALFWVTDRGAIARWDAGRTRQTTSRVTAAVQITAGVWVPVRPVYLQLLPTVNKINCRNVSHRIKRCHS
jgi:hypothetical protein